MVKGRTKKVRKATAQEQELAPYSSQAALSKSKRSKRGGSIKF